VTTQDSGAIIEFIGNMVSAVANAALYDPEHRQVRRLCGLAMGHLNKTLNKDKELRLLLLGGELVWQERRLSGPLSLERFSRYLLAQGIGHISFASRTTERELLDLVAILAGRKRPGMSLENLPGIQVGTLEIRITEEGQGSAPASLPSLMELPAEELARFGEILEAVKNRRRLSMTGVFEIVAGFIQAFAEESQTLLAFAPLRIMDEYSFTHSTNVCLLNLAQAGSLGIEGQLLHDIGVAGLLHDIGKLFVPEEILNKPGRLDPKELAIMQQHPLLGARELLQTKGVPRLAVTAAYEHHLRYNLGGYPRVAGDWNQHLCSQLTAVSDFFDALRSKRAYRDAENLDRVLSLMLSLAGTDLHPVLTRNFIQLRRRLPQD